MLPERAIDGELRHTGLGGRARGSSAMGQGSPAPSRLSTGVGAVDVSVKRFASPARVTSSERLGVGESLPTPCPDPRDGGEPPGRRLGVVALGEERAFLARARP